MCDQLVEIDCVVYQASKPLKPFKPLNPPWIARAALLGRAGACESLVARSVLAGACEFLVARSVLGPRFAGYGWARTWVMGENSFFSWDPDATFGPECAIS